MGLRCVGTSTASLAVAASLSGSGCYHRHLQPRWAASLCEGRRRALTVTYARQREGRTRWRPPLQVPVKVVYSWPSCTGLASSRGFGLFQQRPDLSLSILDSSARSRNVGHCVSVSTVTP